MSFRGRLTLFFVAIVVVPMIAVAVLVVQVTEDSSDGKADARLATGLATAQEIYDQALEVSPKDVTRIASDEAVQRALGAPNEAYLQQVADQEVEDPTVVAVAFYDDAGRVIAAAGPDDALARSRSPLRAAGSGKRIGEILFSQCEVLFLPERHAKPKQ